MQQNNKKKILITGCAGFIGFHLSESLKKRGDDVIGLDNFNDYYDPELKIKRAHLLANQGIEVVKGDINDPKLLLDLIDNQGTTHLVHLAAQAGVRYSLTNPHAYVEANITGFLNILETIRKRPHISLTYASSSSVYGTNTKTPFSEEDRTDHQASFYGVTKKTNELMASTYSHLFGILTTGLRFFTVYGPWGRPDMAYYSFTKAIDEGREIELFNQGKMERDFTYIDDIVEGCIKAIDLESKNAIFNLGNHRSEPLIHLVEAIEKGLNKKAKIRYSNMQLGDVEKTYADISLSQEQLKFFPKTSLSQGILKFIDWYKTNNFI